MHFLEAKGNWELLDKEVRYGPDLRPEPPRDSTPEGSLAAKRSDTHIAGLFRAIGSALDCLGIAVIGLAALPTRIRKGDLARARDGLANAESEAVAPLRTRVDSAVKSAGPPGWLAWTIDMRNSLVHRPARLQLSLVLNVGVSQRKRVLLLPRNPARSDIEAFRDFQSPEEALIREYEEDVLAGVIASAEAVADQVADALLDLAKVRRSNPSVLRQPSSQWPQEPPPARPFRGYGGNRVEPSGGSQLQINPTVGKRMRAARVLGRDQLREWGNFWDTQEP